MLAEQCSDAAYDSRPIGVFENEDDTRRARFHWTTIHAHNSRSRTKECATDRHDLSFRGGRQLEQIGVIAGRAQSRLGHFQSETFGEGWRIHFVDVRATGVLQESF